MSAATASAPPSIVVNAPSGQAFASVLTSEALAFLVALERGHGATRHRLLAQRASRQASLDAGASLDFLSETAGIRESDWTCGPLPGDLLDRRVEITGPADRKMMINALNSGARCYMADLEDSTSPTWHATMSGQVNLRDAVRGTLRFVHPVSERVYTVCPEPAVLWLRPRGLHLDMPRIEVDGTPMSASLVDFGLFVFHCAATLVARGSGPYLYLPKLEHHHEAAWWAAVFTDAERRLGLSRGTLKATVLIETLPAAFQLDEILYALRPWAAGLNCGRWDYLFSAIKCRRASPDALFPDRDQVPMTAPFMEAYTRRVVQVCHRRGVHAMGGMAAQIPIKGDPAANKLALDKVRADKLREVEAGHDGTWVAHPGLVPLAMAVFDAHMAGPNQLARVPDPSPVTTQMLLDLPQGNRTEAGLRKNLRVGLQYLAAWLGGQGCVPIDHLMEDAATAEICRTQVWQWVHHRATLGDGRTVDLPLVYALLAEELSALRAAASPMPHLELAARLFAEWTAAELLPDFLTVPASAHLRDLPE